MDYNQFKRLLENGEISKRESINVLFEFVSEFPYFQTAQAMLAKAMHEQQHVRYEKQLKTAAAYSGDRKSLLNMIHPGESKIYIEKPEIIDRPEISEPVFEEIRPGKIFTDEVELSIPPVEETIKEEALSETEVHFENYKIPAPVVYYNDDMNYDEMEPEDDYDEPKAADPHEIIRRRLNEILGFKEEKDKNQKTDPFVINIEDNPRQPVEPNEVKESSVSNELLKEDDFTEKTKETEEIKGEEIVETIDAAKENFLNRITNESKKVLDDIDKGELEYALEASLIHSLESLPVIEKTETEEIVQEKEPDELTFLEWLKYKSNSDYGKVEEVHAYDPISLKENIESKVEEKADVKIEESEIKPLSLTSGKQGFDELIVRFIESDPKIIPSRTEFYSPVNQAKKSITENEDIVSETLAKIYQQQGNLLKARSTYEKLSLLYPEKMTYFAALISEIDKAINNQNKQDL